MSWSDADRIDLNDELVEEYDRVNKDLIEKMYADPSLENPADLKRRQVQGAVLKANYDDVHDVLFDIEDRGLAYDTNKLTDEDSELTGSFYDGWLLF